MDEDGGEISTEEQRRSFHRWKDEDASVEDEDGDEKANVITKKEQLLLCDQDRIYFRSGTSYDTNRLSKPSWIRSTLDSSRVASRERPVLPGRSPGGRRVTLPLNLRVPGEGLPPGDGARGRAFPPGGCWGGGQPPRRVAEASCSSTTATKHLMQVMMALCQANPPHIWRIFDIRRYLRCEGSLGGGQAGPHPGRVPRRPNGRVGRFDIWHGTRRVHAQQPLVVSPCGIKGETGLRCEGLVQLEIS